MAYTPVTWTELVPITAANLDTMDTGIAANADDIVPLQTHANLNADTRTDVNYLLNEIKGTFGVISSGSETANATVAVPAVVGPYVELTVRGALDGTGFLGVFVNSGNVYEWTMGGVNAAGGTVQWEGTSDTAWIAGRWSTILSVATIRIYGGIDNPNGNASLRFDSFSSRQSSTLSLRHSTHSVGRVISADAMTSIGIASRDAGWSSYQWSLSGFRA